MQRYVYTLVAADGRQHKQVLYYELAVEIAERDGRLAGVGPLRIVTEVEDCRDGAPGLAVLDPAETSDGEPIPELLDTIRAAVRQHPAVVAHYLHDDPRHACGAVIDALRIVLAEIHFHAERRDSGEGYDDE